MFGKCGMGIALGAMAAVAAPTRAQVVAPMMVFGKEYIASPNINQAGAPTPGQILRWSGTGAVSNGLRYDPELDEIANQNDAFFPQLIANQADMVVSFRNSAGFDVGAGPNRNAIYFESSAGVRGVWATTAQVDAANLPNNVEGIELWGTELDSNFVSLPNDPGGVAVFTNVGGFAPYLTTIDLQIAIGAQPGTALDLDTLMVHDTFGVGGRFDPGDQLIVGVRANGQFDGGELWVLTRTAAGGITAAFLNHGGVTYNTALNVGALYGTNIEEIDSIEAIPAPGAVGLGMLGSMLALRRRRR